MAMTYSSLISSKGNTGAIATWVSYTRLDLPAIVDEAQPLIYGLLRCREMMTEMMFSATAGQSFVALPARFQDPIGRIRLSSFNTSCIHKDPGFVKDSRTYAETSGTLGASPFTTTSGSNTVSVALTAHGFSQDSVFSTSGAATFNGATINGTFPITAITDANNFTIDISSLGTTPNASSADGGSSVTYVCDNLNQGTPNWFGIWNERIYFDIAFYQAAIGRLQYYQSLPLLSLTNQTNFLTDRYPHLMRVACVTAAADFMKDDAEYQKGMARLTALIDRIGVENDMNMRGMELNIETP